MGHITSKIAKLPPKKKRRLRRISEVQPDLRGSLIVPRAVKSSCGGPISSERGLAVQATCMRLPALGLHKSVRCVFYQAVRRDTGTCGVPAHDNKNPMFCVLAYSPLHTCVYTHSCVHVVQAVGTYREAYTAVPVTGYKISYRSKRY